MNIKSIVNHGLTRDVIVTRARDAMLAHENPHHFFVGQNANSYKSTGEKTAEWKIFSFNTLSVLTKYKTYYVVTMWLPNLRKGKKHQNAKSVNFGCNCPAFEKNRFERCKECLFLKL